jgi:hypothetical protein
VKKLLDLFRGHRPDVRLLSEHLDGRLDASSAAALEEHLSACDACSTHLAELRDVRVALSALPAAEPPRSFRLSPAEARPQQPVRAAQPRWMAGMPALSAAAVLVFAVLVGAEVYGTGGETQFGAARDADNGELLGLFNRNGERIPEAADAIEREEIQRHGDDAGAATAGDASDEAPSDVAGAPTPVAPATGGVPEEYAEPDVAQGDDGATAPPAGVAPPDAAPAPEEVLRTATDDDGGIGGLRIAQALAGLIAVAAGAAAGIQWYRRKEAQA